MGLKCLAVFLAINSICGMYRALLIFFLGGASLLNAQDHDFTLRQCIEYAWLNNPDVRQAVLSNEMARIDKRQSYTNLLPNISLNGGQNYQFGRTIDRFSNQFTDQTIRSNNFSLNAGLLLFNGLQNQNNIRMQKALEQASNRNIDAGRNQIALSVANAFLLIIQADENIKNARFQTESTQQNIIRASKLYEAGRTDQGNLLMLKAQLANEELNLVNAENSKNAALLNLKTLMQYPADKSLDIVAPAIPEELLINTLGVQELYAIAVESMPQIKAAAYQAEAAGFQSRISKGSRYPSISLYASLSTVFSQNAKTITGYQLAGIQPIGYTQGGDTVFQPLLRYQTATIDFGKQLRDNLGQGAGITLNWNIFNGFQVRNQIQKAAINKQISDINLQRAKNNLMNEINSALNSYNAARARFNASKNSVEAQKLSYEFLQKRFEAGAGTSYDFIQAKNSYLQSQSQELQARYELLFRSLILEFYKGNPIQL